MCVGGGSSSTGIPQPLLLFFALAGKMTQCIIGQYCNNGRHSLLTVVFVITNFLPAHEENFASAGAGHHVASARHKKLVPA